MRFSSVKLSLKNTLMKLTFLWYCRSTRCSSVQGLNASSSESGSDSGDGDLWNYFLPFLCGLSCISLSKLINITIFCNEVFLRIIVVEKHFDETYLPLIRQVDPVFFCSGFECLIVWIWVWFGWWWSVELLSSFPLWPFLCLSDGAYWYNHLQQWGFPP